MLFKKNKNWLKRTLCQVLLNLNHGRREVKNEILICLGTVHVTIVYRSGMEIKAARNNKINKPLSLFFIKPYKYFYFIFPF